MIKNYKSFVSESKDIEKSDDYYYKGAFPILKNYDEASTVRDSLNVIMRMIYSYESKERLLHVFNTHYKDVPDTFKRFYNYLFTLLFDDDFETHLSSFLIINAMGLNDNRLFNSIRDNVKKSLKEERDYLDSKVEDILGIDIEEFNELSDKFRIGQKKFKKYKESSTKITPEDPYGEELWYDEIDLVKKAWD